MASTTIPRIQFIDPFYRYKRIVRSPMITAKNGGTTQISIKDLNKLAKDLDRPAEDIIKFIRKTIGSTIFTKGDFWTIKVKLTKEELDDIVETYVEKFVLCKSCGNPETHQIQGVFVCKACGNNQ